MLSIKQSEVHYEVQTEVHSDMLYRFKSIRLELHSRLVSFSSNPSCSKYYVSFSLNVRVPFLLIPYIHKKQKHKRILFQEECLPTVASSLILFQFFLFAWARKWLHTLCNVRATYVVRCAMVTRLKITFWETVNSAASNFASWFCFNIDHRHIGTSKVMIKIVWWGWECLFSKMESK